MWNAGLDEVEAGIKKARENTNNLRYADDTTIITESKEELKSLLMKVKQECEKAGLKVNIQKMKIMASGPCNPQEWLWGVQDFSAGYNCRCGRNSKRTRIRDGA